ncbi:MAG: ATP-binding protein [Opitutaceae bacterium]|nr:ATP-binding protein [Opitutaceae bacterium]
MKIRWNYLLTIWGATLLPLVVAGYFVYKTSESRTEQQAGENLRLLTRLISSEIDQYLTNLKDRIRARAITQEVSLLLEGPAGDPLKIGQVLLSVHNIDALNVGSVALFDGTGRKVADTDAAQGTIDESLSPWVAETLSTGFGVLYADGTAARPSLWVTAPVRNASGKMLGLLRVRVQLSALQQIVSRATSDLNTYAILSDASGIILAHGKAPERIGSLLPEPFPVAKPEAVLASGNATRTAASSPSERFAYQTLATVDWSAAVVQSGEAFHGGTRAVARVILYLGAVSFLVGGIAAVAAAHLMARPITQLAKVARRIEEGSVDQLFPRTGPVEIAALADAFNRMTARLNQSYRELEKQIEETRENEKRLRDVISANPVAQAVVDETGFIVRLNPAFNQLLGYSLSDVPTVQDLWLRLFPEDDTLDRFRHEFSRHLHAEGRNSDAPQSIEVEIPAKSGTKKVVELRGRAFGPMTIIAFHDLTARRRAELEVVRLNVDLEQRVAARTAELTQANAELESFSYAVSHDLRAPLRAIDGFSRALEEDYAGKLDGEALDYLSRIRAASQRMGILIDDLLTLSKVSRAEVHREAVDLSDMALTVWEGIRQADPARSVNFECEPGMRTEGDMSLIRIVIENLLSNAWKYTRRRADAKVSLTCRIQPAAFGREERVYVLEDNGAGFDMRYAAKLFGAFQRLHGQTEFEGTGIGLATVRRIINRHGGRIWAQAEVNKGATFFFTLAEAKSTAIGRSSDSHSPFTATAPRSWP